MFCQRQACEVHRMIKLSFAEVAICSDCIVGCVGSLREYENALEEAGMVDRWDMGCVSPWDDLEN
jgi:ClpX C4-type zinc finger